MRSFVRIAIVLAAIAVIAVGSLAFAKKPWEPVPIWPTCAPAAKCLDVWDPVVCADGVTYSNICYASRACAPGPCYELDGPRPTPSVD